MSLRDKILAATILSLLWSLPVFFGYLDTPNDDDLSPTFLGWIRSDDFHRYGSFIDQTRYQNRILYMDYSAVETQSPRMIAVYFLVLGFVGKLIPLQAQTLWLLSLWAVSFLFVFVLSHFLSRWASNLRQVFYAMVLILFSGGLEFIVHRTSFALPRQNNFWMDGFSTFCTFHNPLKIAGITSVLLIIFFWASWLEKKRTSHLIVVIALILLSWAIHPNSAIPGYIAIVIPVFFASKYLQKPFRWHIPVFRHAPLIIPFGIILMYIVWMRTDATTANIINQYHIPWLVEPFRYYPIRYGLVLPLGIAGVFGCVRRGGLFDIMIAGWWLGAEMFAHFSNMSGLLFQHMVHLPMALFAAWTLEKIMSGSTKVKWIVIALIAFNSVFQHGYVINKVIHQTRQDVWPTSLYWTQGEIQAARKLRGFPQGNVLVSRNSGNKVAWLALQPVLLGHWGTTPSRREKEQALKDFFDKETPMLERHEIINRYAIDYIWYGPDEQQIGDLDVDLLLDEVIKNSAVTVYRVLHIRGSED